jgi:hypothetical protein
MTFVITQRVEHGGGGGEYDEKAVTQQIFPELTL